MPYITKEYKDFLQENHLIERWDNTKLSALSAKAGIKEGAGLHRKTFFNIMEKGHFCSDEIFEMIKTFYDRKFDFVKEQSLSVKKMKKQLSNA